MDATVFVADVHLTGKRDDREARFLAFLGSLAARAREEGGLHLVLCGDIFNFWYEPRGGRVHPGYAPALRALGEFTGAGGRLTVLNGNRDFDYGDSFRARTGGESAGDRLEITLAGRRVLALHGDTLVKRDLRYRAWRWLVRRRIVAFVFKLFPVAFALGIVRLCERMSERENVRKAEDIPPDASHPVLGASEAALAREFEAGFDVVIAGHFHGAEHRRVETPRGACDFFVLGAWSHERNPVVLECNDEDIEMKELPA